MTGGLEGRPASEGRPRHKVIWTSVSRWLGVLLVGLAACGCGWLPGSAEDVCSRVAQAYGGTVAGAFATDLGRIRNLVPGQSSLDSLAELPATQAATLCYLDAELKKGGPGLPPPNRVVVASIDGNDVLIVAGYRDTLPVTAP